MELLNFFQELFLWTILFLYLHIARFIDLTTNTTVETFKDYLNYQKRVVIVIILTQVLIFAGYCILKYAK